jgi:hypothetical protein
MSARWTLAPGRPSSPEARPRGAHRSRRGLAALAALLGALALALVGCGGSSVDASPPTQAAQRAVDRAGGVGTADVPFRFTGEVRTSTSATGDVAFPVSGAADPKGRQVEVSLDLSAIGRAAGIDLDGRMRVVATGERAWLSMPFLADRLGLGDRPWIGFDLADLARASGRDASQILAQARQTTSATSVGYLRGAEADFVRVGPEAVRGVETTHYRGTVDLDRAVARAPAAERDAIRASIDSTFGKADARRLPVEVWLDAQGRVRKESVTYEARAGDERATVTVEFEFFDIGDPVSVTPPPPAAVTPYSEIASRLSSS